MHDEKNRVVRILVADDFLPARMVVETFLERAGYQVDVADDGRQAVEAFERGGYDLILMDFEMPEMDGIEATRAIRLVEQGLREGSQAGTETKPVHAPIVGMTGHAAREFAEICRKAGMDDCIAKPVHRSKLLETVRKWTLPSTVDRVVSVPDGRCRRSSPLEAPMDFDRAVEEFEGDEEFLLYVLSEFFKECRHHLENIRKALREGDAGAVASDAHAVKGGAANLTANDLAGIAQDLERLGKSRATHGGEDLLARFESESLRLELYVAGKGLEM
jgi:CheY-like chemotaxis protein/HPt (histidine-containing phosphotransfer) domain-containing protein